MIITEVLGNTNTDEHLVVGKHIDYVSMPSPDLVKRIQRVTTHHEHEIGIRLPAGASDLQDGDILSVDDGTNNAIVVSVKPTDVLVIIPSSIEKMGFVAHSLGNRHLQAQFFGANSEYEAETMVVQYDHTVEDFLQAHSVPHYREARVMPVPFRHAEHSH